MAFHRAYDTSLFPYASLVPYTDYALAFPLSFASLVLKFVFFKEKFSIQLQQTLHSKNNNAQKRSGIKLLRTHKRRKDG